MFAYIDNHGELTQSMVNQYNDSLIFLGDEKQIFVPLINAYVGIGTTAYENLLSRIGESNNNLDEYNKYIHNDTVTMYTFGMTVKELEQTSAVLDYYTKKYFGMDYSSTLIKVDILAGLIISD